MLAAGQILQNRYRIIRQLGQGGMGAVYEAEDKQRFGKKVALKEILLNLTEKHSAHFRRAFEREAKILTQIDHEAVPKVIGYILETDYQILVMELIKGDDLDEILEREEKPFPFKQVLDWTNQLLDALDYLHTLEQPIIHRDIKPQNLKLTARNRIKLLDFGIAKDTDTELSSTKSTHKTFVGATLYYSPIEQIIRIPEYFEMLDAVDSEKARKIVCQPADARSDIYALGATIYHLLTNKLPKPAHVRAFEVWTEKSDSLKPLHEINPLVSKEVSDIILKAMAVLREDRFASAFEMQTSLQSAIMDENRRIETEERFKLMMEQERIQREREELEAEKRKLAEERRQYRKNDAEAERKRQEELEYETKLKEWQKKNSSEIIIEATKPLAETQPSVENPQMETSFDWSELAEKKDFMEKSSPSYLEGVELEPAPVKSKIESDTIENDKPKTAPVFVTPTVPEKKKRFWIFSAIFGAIFIFGITAFGLFLIFINSDNSPANKSNENPGAKLPLASPTLSATPTATPEASVTPTPAPTQSVIGNENPKPTVAPTQNRQPVQTPAKTPQTQKTVKPIPTKDPGCVYNGDC